MTFGILCMVATRASRTTFQNPVIRFMHVNTNKQWISTTISKSIEMGFVCTCLHLQGLTHAVCLFEAGPRKMVVCNFWLHFETPKCVDPSKTDTHTHTHPHTHTHCSKVVWKVNGTTRSFPGFGTRELGCSGDPKLPVKATMRDWAPVRWL